MNRVENSIRAGIDIRPMIGPTTKPTNRSIAVHSPPPTTWQKTSPQRASRAIATTTPTSTSATIGNPLSGTITTGGRSAAGLPAGAWATAVTARV